MGKIPYRQSHGKTDEMYEGLHESLVSPELWERCQRIRAMRHGASRAVQKPYRVYLLSNLAHCDVCGRRLRSQASKTGQQYYREMSYERGYLDCPHQSIGVRADLVDQQIHALIAAIELPADWQQELAARVGDDEEVYTLRRQRQSLEAERRRIKEMYLRGDFSEDRDLYESELARVRRELDSLPTEDQLENLGATALDGGQFDRGIKGRAGGRVADRRDVPRRAEAQSPQGCCDFMGLDNQQPLGKGKLSTSRTDHGR